MSILFPLRPDARHVRKMAPERTPHSSDGLCCVWITITLLAFSLCAQPAASQENCVTRADEDGWTNDDLTSRPQSCTQSQLRAVHIANLAVSLHSPLSGDPLCQ